MGFAGSEVRILSLFGDAALESPSAKSQKQLTLPEAIRNCASLEQIQEIIDRGDLPEKDINAAVEEVGIHNRGDVLRLLYQNDLTPSWESLDAGFKQAAGHGHDVMALFLDKDARDLGGVKSPLVEAVVKGQIVALQFLLAKKVCTRESISAAKEVAQELEDQALGKRIIGVIDEYVAKRGYTLLDAVQDFADMQEIRTIVDRGDVTQDDLDLSLKEIAINNRGDILSFLQWKGFSFSQEAINRAFKLAAQYGSAVLSSIYKLEPGGLDDSDSPLIKAVRYKQPVAAQFLKAVGAVTKKNLEVAVNATERKEEDPFRKVMLEILQA